MSSPLGFVRAYSTVIDLDVDILGHILAYNFGPITVLHMRTRTNVMLPLRSIIPMLLNMEVRFSSMQCLQAARSRLDNVLAYKVHWTITPLNRDRWFSSEWQYLNLEYVHDIPPDVASFDGPVPPVIDTVTFSATSRTGSSCPATASTSVSSLSGSSVACSSGASSRPTQTSATVTPTATGKVESLRPGPGGGVQTSTPCSVAGSNDGNVASSNHADDKSRSHSASPERESTGSGDAPSEPGKAGHDSGQDHSPATAMKAEADNKDHFDPEFAFLTLPPHLGEVCLPVPLGNLPLQVQADITSHCTRLAMELNRDCRFLVSTWQANRRSSDAEFNHNLLRMLQQSLNELVEWYGSQAKLCMMEVARADGVLKSRMASEHQPIIPSPIT